LVLIRRVAAHTTEHSEYERKNGENSSHAHTNASSTKRASLVIRHRDHTGAARPRSTATRKASRCRVRIAEPVRTATNRASRAECAPAARFRRDISRARWTKWSEFFPFDYSCVRS